MNVIDVYLQTNLQWTTSEGSLVKIHNPYINIFYSEINKLFKQINDCDNKIIHLKDYYYPIKNNIYLSKKITFDKYLLLDSPNILTESNSPTYYDILEIFQTYEINPYVKNTLDISLTADLLKYIFDQKDIKTDFVMHRDLFIIESIRQGDTENIYDNLSNLKFNLIKAKNILPVSNQMYELIYFNQVKKYIVSENQKIIPFHEEHINIKLMIYMFFECVRKLHFNGTLIFYLGSVTLKTTGDIIAIAKNIFKKIHLHNSKITNNVYLICFELFGAYNEQMNMIQSKILSKDKTGLEYNIKLLDDWQEYYCSKRVFYEKGDNYNDITNLSSLDVTDLITNFNMKKYFEEYLFYKNLLLEITGQDVPNKKLQLIYSLKWTLKNNLATNITFTEKNLKNPYENYFIKYKITKQQSDIIDIPNNRINVLTEYFKYANNFFESAQIDLDNLFHKVSKKKVQKDFNKLNLNDNYIAEYSSINSQIVKQIYELYLSFEVVHIYHHVKYCAKYFVICETLRKKYIHDLDVYPKIFILQLLDAINLILDSTSNYFNLNISMRVTASIPIIARINAI